MIPILIDKQDTVEIVRDQIAAILKSESDNQRALAEADGKDPAEWTFRCFIERSNPWAEFLDATEPQPPIINVSVESGDYNQNTSTISGDFIGTRVLFNIDCYGHGMSQDDAGGDGHVVGDEMSSLEAQRAMRWVRNVFSSGFYTYLEMQGTVHQRWIDGFSIVRPEAEGREIQQVVAARLAFRVMFNEFAPQYEGEELEIIGATIIRKSTGEIYFEGEYE